MTKRETTEKENAIAQLRQWISPGDTVYTILDHVSRSGMSRHIRVVLMKCENGKTIDLHPNYSVARALGLRQVTRNGRRGDALVVGGCGMDMGFHIVYSLARVLFADGFTCCGKDCPSNDHSNAYYDKRPSDRTDPFWRGFKHSDPGYALIHRWL